MAFEIDGFGERERGKEGEGEHYHFITANFKT